MRRIFDKTASRKNLLAVLLIIEILVLVACGREETKQKADELQDVTRTEVVTTIETTTEQAIMTAIGTIEEIEKPEEQVTTQIAVDSQMTGKIVVIDAGHQRYGNSDQEPIGPGASETKAKVTGGTVGTTTGIAEYELNLQVADKLKNELQNRGYSVIMVRESNDVDISNSERAMVANQSNADVFVRIHANGSTDPDVNGIMTICQTSANPYNGYLYQKSRLLSESVLEAMVEATGAHKEYVWETDTMSGVNWAQVPTTIIEMGYMTNSVEDSNLANDSYQNQLVQGIANGIDNYISNR